MKPQATREANLGPTSDVSAGRIYIQSGSFIIPDKGKYLVSGVMDHDSSSYEGVMLHLIMTIDSSETELFSITDAYTSGKSFTTTIEVPQASECPLIVRAENIDDSNVVYGHSVIVEVRNFTITRIE